MNTAFWFASGTLLLAGALTLACSSPKEQGAPAAATPATETKTWGGELTPVVSVRELMRDLIDPLADNIFESVGIEVSKAGEREWEPRTDADWAKVRTGAVALAEASYLLKIPRPIEPEGWEKEKRDADSGELLPPDVLARIQKDPVLWQAKIEALRNVGKEVLEIVEKKDAKALFGANEDLEAACENCHIEFWYPSQKELFEKLNKMSRNGPAPQ